MRYVISVVLAATLKVALGQQVVTLSEVARHKLPHAPAVLPKSAQDALVDGTVTLRVSVNEKGAVFSATYIDGPEALRDAAIHTVQGWSFRPFRGPRGSLTAVTGLIEVNFALSPAQALERRELRERDTRTASAFFSTSDRCHVAIRASIGDANDHSCADAAELAKQFPPRERFIERRGAFVFAAEWFLRNNDGEHALPYAELAVSEVEKGHDDDSGKNAAYTVRGEAKALTGQLQDADKDLETAEDHERKGIAWAATAGDAPTLTVSYTAVLRRNLRVRAVVLRRLGRTREADQQDEELRSLGGSLRRTPGEAAR